MNKYFKFFFILLIILFSTLFTKPPKKISKIKQVDPMDMNFNQWVNFVKNDWYDVFMPGEDVKRYEDKLKKVQKIISEFNDENMKILENKKLWIKQTLPVIFSNFKKFKKNSGKKPVIIKSFNDEYFQEQKNNFVASKLPFAEKLIISKKSKVFVFGDFHGNFDAIEKIFKNFIERGILNDRLEIQGGNYFIFLGDYVDRAQQGIEVLLTLFKLKIKNPKKVILIRGNHESLSQNLEYGFFLSTEMSGWSTSKINGELLKKTLTIDEKNVGLLISSILFSYEVMPFTVFLGYKNEDTTKFIELSHGAIDHRYNPKSFLDSDLFENESIQFSLIKLEYKDFMDLKSILKNYNTISSQPNYVDFSFNWSDIDPNPLKPVFVDLSDRGIAFKYSTKFIDKYFDKVSSGKSKIEMLIRGHDHKMPYEMRTKKINNKDYGYLYVNDKIGAFPIGKTAVTLLSGIYDTEDFDWYSLNYYPTFLELTILNKDLINWDVKIKYLEKEEEKTDNKFEFLYEKKTAAEKIKNFFEKNIESYKKNRVEETKKIDAKIKNLNLNENLSVDELNLLRENLDKVFELQKNTEKKENLSEFIKSDNFSGGNKEFADFILTLRYRSNYQDYISKKLKELIDDRNKSLKEKNKGWFSYLF